jgi:hypothetical protein
VPCPLDFFNFVNSCRFARIVPDLAQEQHTGTSFLQHLHFLGRTEENNMGNDSATDTKNTAQAVDTIAPNRRALPHIGLPELPPVNGA